MQFRILRPLAAAVFLSVGTATIAAQEPTPAPRPPAGQARAMLEARPDLVLQLRQRLLSSGMTRDQIHARLRAEGYPEDLLDSYLPGAPGSPSDPTTDVYAALQELGVADSSDVSFLRALQSDSLTPSARDALLRANDSTYVSASDRARNRRVVVRSDVADSIARLDSGYNIFGLEIFRSASARLDATVFGPVDANYRLGPGDRLVLILTGDVEASYALDVTREGFIVIPQVGQVYVANLTLGQLESDLYTRLGRVYSGVRRGAGATTRFSISVARLRTNQVYVMGAVERPGSYMVSSAGTALTSLYAAGGPTANGSLRSIEVKRGGRTVTTVDLYDYLLQGDASRDARLESGDIVFVPTRGARVRVVGEVIRPATYEMKAGETVADAIAAAGGFRADALQGRVQVERILPPDQRVGEGRVRVTIEVAANQGGGALPVVGGDVIRVFPIAARVRNTITVVGSVWTPGAQGLTPGTTISQAVQRAGGLKPDTYLGQVLVSRLLPDSTRTQLRAAFRDTTGAVVGDFVLREDDRVEVFSVTDFRADRYVSIGGAVRKSGRVPYRRGMTMRDLILLAGGLEESAYLKEAEIARLPPDRAGATTAITMRVPLDSTYLFDRRLGEPYAGPPGIQAAASGAPEVELEPYDNVLIMHQPSWELQRVVRIAGEVRFPGQYALRSRDERIADLVDRAGGLTIEAYPQGTVFLRKRGDVGRVAIDVDQALRRRNSPDNLLLVDGDDITIPQRSYTVTVRGAVNAPNVVAFMPGRDLQYYISQAGGPAREADPDRAFVTQPSGKRETVSHRVLFPDGQPEPLPGSIVIVPERDPTDRANYTQVLTALAPIISTLATLAAVIITTNAR